MWRAGNLTHPESAPLPLNWLVLHCQQLSEHALRLLGLEFESDTWICYRLTLATD